MNKFERLLLTYVAVLTLHHSLGTQRVKKFKLQPKPTRGVQRLSAGWTDLSLTSCILQCTTKYSTCQIVLYNHVTGFCTPGQGLSLSESVPTADEGDFYSTCRFDLGFELYTHNGAQACMFDSPTEVNFTDAKALCHSKGAHLFTMKTLDKMALVETLPIYYYLWAGLTDIEEEDRWIWEDDGSEVTAHQRSYIWAVDHPNNFYPDEDCPIIYPPSGYRLFDIRCRLLYGTLCETYL